MALEALKHYACIADKVFTPPDPTEVASTSGKDAPSYVKRIRNQFMQAAHFQEGPNGSLGCLMGNFAGESDTLPASFRKLINQSFKRWDAAIAASLKLAQERGEIDPSHNPEELGRYLMASWQGALLLMKNSKSRVPIDDFFHFTLHVLLKADATKGSEVKRKLQRPRKKA